MFLGSLEELVTAWAGAALDFPSEMPVAGYDQLGDPALATVLLLGGNCSLSRSRSWLWMSLVQWLGSACGISEPDEAAAQSRCLQFGAPGAYKSHVTVGHLTEAVQLTPRSLPNRVEFEPVRFHGVYFQG